LIFRLLFVCSLIENVFFVFSLSIKDAIRIEYAPIIQATEANLDEKYNQLERQHGDFAVHIQTQISQIQQQIHQFHQVQQQTPPPPLPLPPPPPHLLNNTFGISKKTCFCTKFVIECFI